MMWMVSRDWFGFGIAVVSVAANSLLYVGVLSKQLMESANLEINTDKEVLSTRMAELGFQHDIIEAFGEVERRLMGAATGFDFRGCMDLSRAAFEKIVEEAARIGVPIKHGTLPPPGSTFNRGSRRFKTAESWKRRRESFFRRSTTSSLPLQRTISEARQTKHALLKM
jgi:hypothetical protein